MTTRAENINSSILAWAREKAALSIEEAAGKLGLSSSERSSAAEKLAAFEEGKTKPTRNQLLKLATLYRFPLTVFYKSEPPRNADRVEDFRTLPEPVSLRENALLDALLRDIRTRQGLVRAILEDDEDTSSLDFIGSLQVGQDPAAAAAQIRKTLGIERGNWTESFNKPDELFKDLRNRIENLGVFVLLIGNLGSHHSDIDEKVFRGFAIADDLAPFIVVNNHDARRAWSFTLAHELAHLFVGETGISGAPTIEESHRVERFCDNVAGEMLLPAASLKNIATMTSVSDASNEIAELVEAKNLSSQMIALRLHRMGRIDKDAYNELNAIYAAGLRSRKEKEKKSKKGGPSYHAVRRHGLGNALLNLVGRTLRENQLTHTAAARMLGVNPNSVERLLQGVKGVSGSHSPKAGG